jgi:hypothetical protein
MLYNTVLKNNKNCETSYAVNARTVNGRFLTAQYILNHIRIAASFFFDWNEEGRI